MCKLHKERCNLESNTSKLKAFVPTGGVEGVPGLFLDAQGVEILDFKCPGAYVGADTPASDEWKIDQLTQIRAAQRGALARINRYFEDLTIGPQERQQIAMAFTLNNGLTRALLVVRPPAAHRQARHRRGVGLMAACLSRAAARHPGVAA